MEYQLESVFQSWVDGIKKAQELYATAKQAPVANMMASTSIPVTSTTSSFSRQPSSCYYEDDDIIDPECQNCASYNTAAGLVPSRSPRGGSSRGSRGSSLVHSHRQVQCLNSSKTWVQKLFNSQKFSIYLSLTICDKLLIRF